MKLIPILTTLCILISPSCSFGVEHNKITKITPEASLLKIAGTWEVINIEGKDAKSYKDVIEKMVVKFEAKGRFTMTVTYKKNAIVQFQGVPNMSPDGKVVTTGQLVMKDKVIKMIAKGYEDEPSTVLFRKGNLISIDEGEDANFVFRKTPTEKDKKMQNKAQ